MRNGQIIITAFVMLFGSLFLTLEARAQTATGYTSIEYYADTNTVDAYSETDEDYDVDSAYGAYVSLSVNDQNWNLMGHQTATDDGTYGFAAVDIQFSGSPDMTYTATGLHKANAREYYYDYQFWPNYTIVYYDFYNFGSFENQNIVSPWQYFFLGPGPTATRANPLIILGSSYDSASASTPGCVKPVRESSTFGGWADSDGFPTAAKWDQRLFPTNKNFSGRHVTETDPGGGVDGCHFTGSRVASFTSVDGDTWTVGTGNQWGDDANGWDVDDISYYRNQGRAPCSTTVPQRMVIDCPSGTPAVYTTHALKLTIGTDTIISWHNGAIADRAWP